MKIIKEGNSNSLRFINKDIKCPYCETVFVLEFKDISKIKTEPIYAYLNDFARGQVGEEFFVNCCVCSGHVVLESNVDEDKIDLEGNN